jgi:hypothetical protein
MLRRDDCLRLEHRLHKVESGCHAVAVGRTYLFPPLSSGGALVAVQPWLRFHIPLIEPDVRIARIRLSDKSSRLHPRHVVPKPAQAYEPEVPVKVREWIGPAPASPDFVLDARPPAQPHSGVVVDRPVRFGDGAYFKVVRPSAQRAVQLVHQLCGLLPTIGSPIQYAMKIAGGIAGGNLSQEGARRTPAPERVAIRDSTTRKPPPRPPAMDSEKGMNGLPSCTMNQSLSRVLS